MGNKPSRDAASLRASGLTPAEERELKRAFKHGRRNNGNGTGQEDDEKDGMSRVLNRARWGGIDPAGPAGLQRDGFRAALLKLAAAANKSGVFPGLGKLEAQHADMFDVIAETLFNCFDVKHNGEIDWQELATGLAMFLRGEPRERVEWAFSRMQNRCVSRGAGAGSPGKPRTTPEITRKDIALVVTDSVRMQRTHQRFLETRALSSAVKLCENLGRTLSDAQLSRLRAATAAHVAQILAQLEASVDAQVERSMRILDCDGDGVISLDDFRFAVDRNPELLRLLDPLSVYDVLHEATSGDPKVVASVVSTCEAAATVFSKHKPRHRGSMVAPGDFANMLAQGWDGDTTVQEGGLGDLGDVHSTKVRRRAKRRSILMLEQDGLAAVGEDTEKSKIRQGAGSKDMAEAKSSTSRKQKG